MAKSAIGAVVSGIFAVVGDSLNFGGRRMETILRVAWLPVTLLLVLDMATVFAYLSIAAGRPISFADVATYVEARSALNTLWGIGWANHPASMATVFGASIALQLVLISSFMAPLIRYAGLRETPPPGVLRLAFGFDQVRFLVGLALAFLILPALMFAPIGATAYYVIKYLFETFQHLYASFPDPDSLHTVRIVRAQELFAERGELWIYTLGIPTVATLPFALLAWWGLFRHFRPRRPDAGARALPRAIATLVGGAGAVWLLWRQILAATGAPAGSAVANVAIIAALAICILVYVNIRALPYAGVAVCQRSFAVDKALSVTRGWRLIWLVIAILFILVLTSFVQIAINFAFGLFGATFSTIYLATESASKLTNGGEAAGWIYPTFLTTWNIIKIVANIFWTFFTYGVFAGFLGRLYRESERADP